MVLVLWVEAAPGLALPGKPCGFGEDVVSGQLASPACLLDSGACFLSVENRMLHNSSWFIPKCFPAPFANQLIGYTVGD